MNELIHAHLEWMPGASYALKTIRDRRIALHAADARLPRGIDDVYPSEIAAYLRSPNWSRWTAHTAHGHLAGFYRWAAGEGLLSLDPMAGMRPPRGGAARPKPITAAELSIVLKRSEDPWLTAAVLAVGAGLRAGELAQIRREDVSEDFVHVRCGKGGRERYVDTCPMLWGFVRGRPPGLLVRRPYGRAVTAAWLSSAQRRHWIGIGLPLMHWHRLRHTFATAMHEAGVDPLVLRDLMGHSSVASTQLYVRTAAEQRRAAIGVIDGLLDQLG